MCVGEWEAVANVRREARFSRTDRKPGALADEERAARRAERATPSE